MNSVPDRRFPNILIVDIAVAVLAAGIRLSAGAWPIDDAYITLRYAENLAAGVGAVYNAGQPVLGTSSPLLMLVLASLRAATRMELPTLALLVGVTADAVGAVVLFHLGMRLLRSRWAAVGCAVLWLLNPLVLRYAISGMETSLVSCLLVGAILLHLQRHDSLAICCGAFAALARPDAAAVASLLLLITWIENRRAPVTQLLILAGILLPWVTFATLFYGSAIPQSIMAKSQLVYHIDPMDNFRQVAYHFSALIIGAPARIAAQGLSVQLAPGSEVPLLLAGAVQLPLFLAGAFVAVRDERRWAALFGVPIIFAAVYSAVGLRSNALAEWYLVPLMPLYFLGLWHGTQHIMRHASLTLPRWPGILLAAIAIGLQLTGMNLGQNQTLGWSVPRIAWTEREQLYRQSAEFIRERLVAGQIVAASEIGALGYFCGCQILDTVGLVSPRALLYYPLPEVSYEGTMYSVPSALILGERPDYLVSLDVFTRRTVLVDDRFLKGYHLAWIRATDAFGSTALQVWEVNQ